MLETSGITNESLDFAYMDGGWTLNIVLVKKGETHQFKWFIGNSPKNYILTSFIMDQFSSKKHFFMNYLQMATFFTSCTFAS